MEFFLSGQNRNGLFARQLAVDRPLRSSIILLDFSSEYNGFGQMHRELLLNYKKKIKYSRNCNYFLKLS
ncbi:hypothetical protein D3Z60_11975 [Lachnospiraceae bacterium]|nr:hypothetical protein [Lachnospiraceae bacterium]